MITGLKIDVPGAELIEHLEARASQHESKATAYGTQAKGIHQLQADDEGELSGLSNNPTHSLAQSAKQHEAKAGILRFMARHLDAKETYRLDQQDLILAEIIDRGW